MGKEMDERRSGSFFPSVQERARVGFLEAPTPAQPCDGAVSSLASHQDGSPRASAEMCSEDRASSPRIRAVMSSEDRDSSPPSTGVQVSDNEIEKRTMGSLEVAVGRGS